MKECLKYINSNIKCDFKYLMYHEPCSMYSDREACKNSEDPDQMLHNVASDQSLHCLPLIQVVVDTSTSSEMDLFEG